MSHSVEVTIAGRDYTLLTEQSDEYMHRLADYVSAHILGFKRQNNASAVDAATMAALAIADELLKLREKEKARVKERAAERAAERAKAKEKTKEKVSKEKDA